EAIDDYDLVAFRHNVEHLASRVGDRLIEHLVELAPSTGSDLGADRRKGCRARPVPASSQHRDMRQSIEKSRMTSSPQGWDWCLLQRSVTKRAVEMLSSANPSADVGTSSHASVPQETLEFPRYIICHAGARAAPGPCEAGRWASEAQKWPIHLCT